MHIYVKNNHAKFDPDLIGNDGFLDFFEEHPPNKNSNKASSNGGQFMI